MEMGKFIRIFNKTEDVVAEEMKKRHEKRSVLLHTLLLSAILNVGILIIFFDEPVLGLLLAFPAFVLTMISIPLIEYLTYLTAKSQGGRGDYWDQLNITNIYLTPIFLLFFAAFSLVTLLGLAGISLPDFPIGLDTLSLIFVIYLNYKKIKTVHAIDKALVPSIIYAVCVAAAYVLWVLLIFGPILILMIIGGAI